MCINFQGKWKFQGPPKTIIVDFVAIKLLKLNSPEGFGHRARATCFVVEQVVVCCSCTLIFGPLLGTFCFNLLCLRCKQIAKLVFASVQNRGKMLREVTFELDGAHFVPQMGPG